MKKIIAAALMLYSAVVLANCYTNTIVNRDGTMTICTTCCYAGNCTTTCM